MAIIRKVHLPRVRSWLYCNLPVIKRSTTAYNQKQYPDLVSDASSEWNFCARFSDVIWRETSECRQMSAVFSDNPCFLRLLNN